MPNVIALVGLPARGKTYISHKLCRYLNWIGIKTRAFNVGEYRRRACHLKEQVASDFFSPKNVQGSRIREYVIKNFSSYKFFKTIFCLVNVQN